MAEQKAFGVQTLHTIIMCLIQTCNFLRSTFLLLLIKPKISRRVHACQLFTFFDKNICELQNGKPLYSRVCHKVCSVSKRNIL
jgi:hypothetical protein